MTKSSHWLLAGALAWFAALSACGAKSNSGSNGTSGPPVPVACLGEAFSSTCDACIQTSCESALSSLGSNCSDYIDCYCPNGAYSASAQISQSCLSKVTANPSCLSAVESANNCVNQSCATACQGSGSGGAGDGGPGGGSGGSGGSGGGMTAACGIAFTTSSCASCVNSQCCSATQACAMDPKCVGIISCIHGCNNMSCEQMCITSAPSSAQTEISNAVQCWAASCGRSGC